LNLPPGSCETHFYLGKVYADTQKWQKSGEYFEQAAGCDHETEIALEAKIQEIESAPLTAARKARLIRNKQAQVLQTRNSKATAWYNAAAGYFNAQRFDNALALAQRASTHPAFREKAEDLILAIKQKK
jgi:tetratricopeptide (TPR) repeat protein